jgi:hypothetical protein
LDVTVPSPKPGESARRPQAGSRTQVDARITFPGADEDAEEIATPTRRFSVFEIASGLPDDSREEDERAAERRLREMRARVRAARAVVTTTPGLAQILAGDWRKAAGFYARCGISETHIRYGVPG